MKAMTVHEAIEALPFKLVKWRESVMEDGDVEILVTCQKPDGLHVHVAQRITGEEVRTINIGYEQLVGLHRARIVETFCHSHPEGLPRGLANLGTGEGL